MQESITDYIDKVFIYTNSGNDIVMYGLLGVISIVVFILCLALCKNTLEFPFNYLAGCIIGTVVTVGIFYAGLTVYEGRVAEQNKELKVEIEELQMGFVADAIKHRVDERSLPPIGVLETDLGITKENVGSVVVKSFNFDLDLLEDVNLYVVSSELYLDNEVLLLDMNVLKRQIEKSLNGVTVTSGVSNTGMLGVDNFKVDTNGTVVSDIAFVINIK